MPIQSKFSTDTESFGPFADLVPADRRQPKPDTRPAGPWNARDEPVTDAEAGLFADLMPVNRRQPPTSRQSGAWGADDELVDESARRALPTGVKPNESAGSGRGRTQGKGYGALAMASDQPLGNPMGDDAVQQMPEPMARGDERDAITSGPLADKTLRVVSRANADPLLRPEFVAGIRTQLGAMPEQERLPALRALAAGTDIRARAAKLVLRDVEAENTAAQDLAAQMPTWTDAIAKQPARAVGGGGRPPKVAIPDLTPERQLVTGRSAKALSDEAVGGGRLSEANTSAEAFAQRASNAQRDIGAEQFAKDNPLTGALASGSAQQIRGAINIVPTVLDFAARLAGIDTSGINGEGETSAYLKRLATSYMPKVGQQGIEDAWGRGEFGGWLMTNLVAQTPQIAQSVVAAFVPGMQGMALTSMGAIAAGSKFADTGNSAHAAASGAIEAGSEMLPLHFLQRSFHALQSIPAAERGQVLQAVGRALPKVGVAVAANHIVGAIEESAAQVGNNLLDIANGEKKSVMDGVLGAAVIGAAMSGLLSGPKAVGALSFAAKTEERRMADAMNADVQQRDFQPGDIAGYAARAQNPRFYDQQFVDPRSTTRASFDVGPPAPVRAEDMPKTPWTPEQSAAMAAESQARKQAQAQADQDGAQRADGNAVAPMPQPASDEPLQGRQATGEQEIQQINRAGADRTQRPVDEATRGVQDRAGIAQPGQLARGSIADEARRRIAAKTPAAGADEVAAPTGQPQRTPGTTDESSGIRQQAAQPAASITAPAKIEPAEAQSKLPPTEQAASGGGTSAPAPSPAPADAFASRDAALVAAVQRGQWQRLEPAQAPDGAWRLTARQQPAPAAPTAPPKAAQQGADVAQTHAETTSAGSTATGQAAPMQDTQPQAGVLNRQSRPEATPPQAQATDLQSTAATAGAAHAEPGGQAGPATAPVVAQSMAKAADNTERKPSELRADLVRQIDAAMAGAPDEDLPVWKRPTQERLRQAMADLGLPSVDRAEKALRTAHDNRVADTASRIGFADFSVPGDGAFKVLRTASRLAEFKRLVERSAGFKAQRQAAAPELDGAQRGSPSVKAAVENMLAEGDAQAAADYLSAKGLDAADMGLPASALAKLAGVTPATQQADEPAGQAATEPGNGAQASRQTTDATASSRESTPPSANAEALSVRPHELAQADFVKATDFARDGNAANPWSARWRGVQLEADAAGFDHPDLGKTVVAGGRFFPTRKTAMAAAKAAHRRAVQRAQRQGEQISERVMADYPELAPTKSADQQPLDGEVAPDSIGIERAKLRGVSVTMTAQIEETGETATFAVDAAKFLDRLDRVERKALDGRLVSADSAQFTQRLADHLADGAEPEPARRMAMADEIERTREERIELADNLRQQHPELFLGQPADAAVASDEAEVSDDGEPGAEKIRIADETGEKIGGSRRDRWAGRGMNLSDLDAMTEAEAAELVNKAAVWKPDFAAMVAAGSHPKTVAMVKLVADSLAAKPKDNTPVGRRRYVAAMQAVRQAYSDLSQYGEGLHSVEAMARHVLQRASEKLRSELGVHSADPATLREARTVLFSIYKGRSDPFAVGYSFEQRAAKLVADGFPSKAEPWTRRFEIKAIGGAGLTDAGVASYLKTAESLASGITAELLRAGAFVVVGKGSSKARAMAASKADAQAAARTLYAAELTEKPDGKEEPARPHLDKIQRDGLPARIDRDVKADDLLKTFGFRGTEFGNWAAQDERQRILNLAFDGLNDLADILNVPPEALSLNGSLGLAFGARGGGRAAAHYEGGRLVINLTKLQGGGSLAHEWAHAVDHYLGELDRPDAYQTAARGASGWYSKRDYTGQAQRRMVQEAGKWVMREQASLDNLRPELAAAVNKVMAALYGKALPQAEAVRAAELRLERLQARRTEVEPGGDAKLLASVDAALQDAQRTLADAQAGLPLGSVTTDFAKQAQRLSGKQSNGYWLRPTEMLARAFEAYAFDRLVAMGARSQYLVHGVEADRFAGEGYKGNPYPAGEERAAINAAFDGLVKTLQTKRTDKGVALFQRRGSEGSEGSRTLIKADGEDFAGSAESGALRALSENDELFALPRSSAATVEAIAADIDPQIKVRRTVVNSLETMVRLTMPDASFALLIERKPNPFGPQPYDYETVGGEEVPITQRPGDNPEDVPDSTVGIYLDASRLKPGGAGARVYGIAAAYAHNTGGLFIGDPNGLSDEALRRRPEQMLSSALKYGTTRHLAPHPRQTRGDAGLGVPPLRWVYGDDLGNIRRLVAVNLEALQNQHPDADRIDFDPDTRQFTNRVSGVSGRVASQELLFGPADSRGGGDGQRLEEAGRRTIARGAVLRALVREEGREGAAGGQRNGLLARLAGLGNDPATAGLFYSRDGRSQPGSGRVASPEQVSAVQAAAARITAAWQKAPEIRVLASMADAPAAARDADQRQRDAGATGTPSAFILGGRVYLLASELPTDADVASAVLHEAAGHLGLRGVFGPELAAVLGELAALREADVRAKASEYGLDFNVKAERLEAAEELLAELAQTEPELGLVQRAIAAIRTWLRKNLPMLADMNLSDAEVIRSFILPARAFVVDGTVSRGSGATGQAGAGAAFARRRKGAEGSESDRSDDPGTSMAGFRAWLERTGPDAGAAVRFTNTADSANTADGPAPAAAPRGPLPESVEVEGEQRPTRNSAGQPLGVDDEAVRDFWRRFSGSAVVDAQGRPLLLHGATGAQGGFSAVEKGRLGAGAYFRENNDAALQDRAAERKPPGARLPTVGPGYLALRNPYLFNDAAYAWPDGFIIGGALATVAQPARPPRQPPGSPLASLLDRVLPPAQARTNLLVMARSDGYIGPALRDQLEAMGHDGLVVRFADPADGEPAYIAFDRSRAIPAWQGERGADATGGTSDTTGGNDVGGISDDAGGRPGGQQTRLPESIDVDGQQRSTRDASNHYIAASTEAITNFWRWFGDSRAIDSLGRPIPLFHGTGRDVDAFMASRSGMLGSGVYITGNAASANEYATTFNEKDEGRVMSVYARLRNPYFFAMRESWLPDWYDAPINSEFKHPEDLPWGIKLVADVMPRDSARRIIDRLLREGTINIGASLTDRLKAMGHDGIVAFDGEANTARKPDDSIWTDPKNEVVVFDPRAIKSATGNTGEFAEGTRSIRFQRRPVSAEDQPAADFTLRPFGRAGRVIELTQDRYNRWKHAIDDIRKQGGSVTDDNDFYRAEERYWGQVGSGIEDFKDQLKGFVKAVAADGLRIEDVALYAYAQHAEERNEWVAAHRPDSPDSGSGMSTDEADEILQAARQAGVEAELQRHALTLRRWIQGTRDALFDGGLIDQQEHDTWTNMFQKYVPLRGGDAAGQAGAGAASSAAALRGKPKGGIRGDEGEHAQGRTSQALQIIEQIAHDRARALIRSGRNNVLRSFARFALDNPSPGLWEINAVQTRRQAATDEDGYRTLTETDEVIKDGRTITLKDGGEEIHILVHDAKLLEQLQRMGLEERPAWAIGALLSANKWLSRVYTSLSPVFTAMNALRDTQAAAVGMIDEIGFLGAPKLFAALPGAWAESFKAELMGKQSADYQLFKAMGGLTHFHSLKSIEQQADELQAIVNDADRSALDPRKFLPKAMGLIEAINGGIENATRLAAFKVARQSGKTASEASSIAKNITVNFNRKGTQQLASAWILFFNPAVQGTARLAQAMASPKVQATIGVAMMGIAALALRNAGMGDDDDGVAWWDKIPDEAKERNIVIVLPPGATTGEAVPKSKTGRYVKIPMPYGYNFFAVVANQVVDVWRHSHDPRRGRDAVKAGGKAFGAFTSSWLPSADLGRAVTADDAESAGKSAVLLAIPDALDPLARIGLNQDAFGRPMRPDNRFSRHLPDSSGYFAGQHGTLFQRGAGALNEATGGSRYREGLIDVAPSTMEHLARSYGGGPVGFGLDIINALYLRQSIARPELDAKRLPFAKQFIGTIDAETDRMTGYQRLESAEKLIDPIKRAMAAGEGREARALHDEAGPVAGLGDAVVQTRQRLGEIVKRERATIDSQALSDDAKYVKLIDLAEKRRQVLQRFNKAYDRAILATKRQEREPQQERGE